MRVRTLSRRVLVAALAGAAFCLAPSAAQAAVVTHVYDLNGTYADSLGGPSLVSAGGTLGATSYSFAPNQGLTLSGAVLNPANYSIELDFNFAKVSGYNRIVDFKNRAVDTGFYDFNTAANFYLSATGPAGAFAPGAPEHVVLTRDGATGQVVAYVNGVQQFSFIDTTSAAVFTGPGSIINFFIDDLSFPNEASTGSVDRIRIYDGALSAADVAALGSASPVPLPLAAWAGLALGGMVVARRARAARA